MARYAAVLCALLVAEAARDARDTVSTVQQVAPELFMGTVELARRDGYAVETHSVQTADGYLLTLHRLRGRRDATFRGPVFLQHGFLSASHLWLLAGPSSALAYLLADRGYDVWMGNSRGNAYSRRHVSMKPEDPNFWNFSWHEMGLYDLPAAVDHVLATTRHSRLYYMGHSMGNTMAFVLLSMRPEYNSRIRLAVALSPVAFLRRLRSPIGRLFVPYSRQLVEGREVAGGVELLPASAPRSALGYLLCRDRAPTQTLCLSSMYLAYGFGQGLNKTQLPFYLAHLLMGTSEKTMGHFLQNIASGRFQQWDHGSRGNWRRHRSGQPPEYNLRQVTAPAVLVYSDGDDILHPSDVWRLSRQLPRAELFRVPVSQFNHIEFVLHEQVRPLLYERLLDTMDRY